MLMEGYEYLGLVTTIDHQKGLLVVRSTPDTQEEARRVLATFPVPVVLE